MPANTALLEELAAKVIPGAIFTHLGTGGFASTFRVDDSSGHTYALKIVDAAQSDAERSDRELASLQRVTHPNVVGYLGTGTVDFSGVDYRWLKMTFIDGETLVRRPTSKFMLAGRVSCQVQDVGRQLVGECRPGGHRGGRGASCDEIRDP